MKRNNYYPVRQADQIVWLTVFRNRLPGHATELTLAAGVVTNITADCNWIIYLLQSWLPAIRNWSESCTDALREGESGVGDSAQTLPVFAAPALPTGTVAVNPGALARIFALVQQIKDNAACTESISTDLGINGSEKAAPDFATLQPVISASISGGQVNIKWGWGGNVAWLDMCELQVDRGDGKGFVLLAFDTTPNYTDTQPSPTAKTVWTYRAIYHVGDNPVGVWSQPVSISVGG